MNKARDQSHTCVEQQREPHLRRSIPHEGVTTSPRIEELRRASAERVLRRPGGPDAAKKDQDEGEARPREGRGGCPALASKAAVAKGQKKMEVFFYEKKCFFLPTSLFMKKDIIRE